MEWASAAQRLLLGRLYWNHLKTTKHSKPHMHELKAADKLHETAYRSWSVNIALGSRNPMSQSQTQWWHVWVQLREKGAENSS